VKASRKVDRLAIVRNNTNVKASRKVNRLPYVSARSYHGLYWNVLTGKQPA